LTFTVVSSSAPLYHQVVPSVVAFGQRTGCSLDATLEGTIRAESKPVLFVPTEFQLRCSLVLGPVRFPGDSALSDFPSLGAATELADDLLELADYGPPHVDIGFSVVEPRCA
jgi:hypothetical protein